MSKLLFPILIVAGFIFLKILDSFEIPNTFAIVLLVFCIITGVAWCYRRFVALPRRARKVKRTEQRTGQELSDEEKKKLEPISDNTDLLASLFPVLLIVFIVRSFIFEPFQIPSGSMEPTLRVGDFLLVEKYAYGIKDPVFQKKIIPTGEPKRGDVVVFKAPTEPNLDYIKRVVGLPGDTVIYNQQKGELTVIPACKENKDCKPQHYEYTQPHKNTDFVYYGQAQIEETETGAVKHQILLNPVRFNYDAHYYRQPGKNFKPGKWQVPNGHYFVMGDNRDNSDDSRFWGFVPEQALVGKAKFIWLSLDKKENEWPTGLRTDRIFTTIK